MSFTPWNEGAQVLLRGMYDGRPTNILSARVEVADRLARRAYPLDGTWLNWRPDPSWTAPCLPADWDASV